MEFVFPIFTDVDLKFIAMRILLILLYLSIYNKTK